jgi:trimethylamine--corrinoid protein Co-methyltransferase
MYVPIVIGGLSGPVTPPSGMALINAGVPVGLVLSQLKRQGAPFIMPGWGSEGLDMKTLA